eukprot:3940512-Rhodomonas_salina.1
MPDIASARSCRFRGCDPQCSFAVLIVSGGCELLLGRFTTPSPSPELSSFPLPRSSSPRRFPSPTPAPPFSCRGSRVVGPARCATSVPDMAQQACRRIAEVSVAGA